jgi:predicted permease
LLTATALLTRSLLKLQWQDMGFRRANVLLVEIDPQLAGYTEKNLFPLYRSLDERLNQLPGVASAALARYSPVSGYDSSGNFSIAGYTAHAGDEMNVHRVEVGPHFFDTLAIPILLGRPIGVRDTPDSNLVAVVNKTFVAKYFPRENPLGRRFSLGSPFKAPGFEIIGVAADTRYYDLRQNPNPMAFLASWQFKGDSIYGHCLLLRTTQPPLTIEPEVERALTGIDRKLRSRSATTLDLQLDKSLRQQKLMADLCSIFGALALLLSAIGIYGTIAYSVARRTVEIGIRMAVGAPRERVLWMVLRQSLVLMLIGVAIGVPLAIYSVRWIKSFLFGVSAADPLALAAALALVSVAALIAGYLPAHRATKIDPMRALKYE